MIVQFFVAFNNRDSKDYSDSELMGLAVETAHTEFQGQRQNWGGGRSKQSGMPAPSGGNGSLHDLLTSGGMEERVDQLLEELFPTYPASQEKVELPILTDDFNQFELLEQIGQGAFSRVFKAVDKKLGNRLVVLKSGKMIEQEPAIVGRLNHKHIMPIYSSWQDRTGMTTICMPYLGRYTLKDKMVELRRRVSPSRLERRHNTVFPVNWKQHQDFPNLLTILHEICGALAYAHQQEVLHLDLKPSNVLIGFCGHALLLDFNLAGDFLIHKSPTGGTLSYMSPEHLRRCVLQEPVELDVRSDIYSFGVLMFEMFYGFRPFDSAGPAMRAPFQAKIMLQRQTRVSRVFSAIVPRISRRLRKIIEHCLQPDPSDRYPTASELLLDLSRVDRRLRWKL